MPIAATSAVSSRLHSPKSPATAPARAANHFAILSHAIQFTSLPYLPDTQAGPLP